MRGERTVRGPTDGRGGNAGRDCGAALPVVEGFPVRATDFAAAVTDALLLLPPVLLRQRLLPVRFPLPWLA